MTPDSHTKLPEPLRLMRKPDGLPVPILDSSGRLIDYFAIIGLTPNAEPTEIRARLQRLRVHVVTAPKDEARTENAQLYGDAARVLLNKPALTCYRALHQAQNRARHAANEGFAAAYDSVLAKPGASWTEHQSIAAGAVVIAHLDSRYTAVEAALRSAQDGDGNSLVLICEQLWRRQLRDLPLGAITGHSPGFPPRQRWVSVLAAATQLVEQNLIVPVDRSRFAGHAAAEIESAEAVFLQHVSGWEAERFGQYPLFADVVIAVRMQALGLQPDNRDLPWQQAGVKRSSLVARRLRTTLNECVEKWTEWHRSLNEESLEPNFLDGQLATAVTESFVRAAEIAQQLTEPRAVSTFGIGDSGLVGP